MHLSLGQTLIMRLQDYELPFSRDATADHTGPKLHVQTLFSLWFIIHITLQNKFLFTLTNYTTVPVKRH